MRALFAVSGPPSGRGTVLHGYRRFPRTALRTGDVMDTRPTSGAQADGAAAYVGGKAAALRRAAGEASAEGREAPGRLHLPAARRRTADAALQQVGRRTGLRRRPWPARSGSGATGARSRVRSPGRDRRSAPPGRTGPSGHHRHARPACAPRHRKEPERVGVPGRAAAGTCLRVAGITADATCELRRPPCPLRGPSSRFPQGRAGAGSRRPPGAPSRSPGPRLFTPERVRHRPPRSSWSGSRVSEGDERAESARAASNRRSVTAGTRAVPRARLERSHSVRSARRAALRCRES